MTVVPDARDLAAATMPPVPRTPDSATTTTASPAAPAPASAPGVDAAPKDASPAGTAPPVIPPATSFAAAFGAVFRGQLARSKVGRIPLLFVASFQSIGILVLLRGILDVGDTTAAGQVVAGSTVLVVAFVALNLLAQRFGALRAAGALDYYLTLPVPPAAVVLGTAASYAAFAAPGTLITAVSGSLLYGLSLSGLWLLLPVVVLAGVCLSGLGAAVGLLAPRPELATIAGQLGMSIVLFLGVIPADRLPEVGRIARDALPSTYAVDALAAAFQPHVDWAMVVANLAVCAAVGIAALAVAVMALRRVGTS
ncbi:ABC-type multidrug transport system, permease component [Frankia canadensis]|uniref:ABC-type multidrug transport system, permease component n=1 Tax=Frankia canadensis TaxID=1836972 RepID=A0A2I2KPK5_9ACTN|nr:ABC transporter permease [Frankia canadensis]SNQ47569.1 ABC-type multidrug transport system, permease component [Frankia canadensis]SOU54859.1 ABC-type multidrug transport system, permease component [Frankia canadensis]